jgi:hypothetical protein
MFSAQRAAADGARLRDADGDGGVMAEANLAEIQNLYAELERLHERCGRGLLLQAESPPNRGEITRPSAHFGARNGTVGRPPGRKNRPFRPPRYVYAACFEAPGSGMPHGANYLIPRKS